MVKCLIDDETIQNVIIIDTNGTYQYKSVIIEALPHFGNCNGYLLYYNLYNYRENHNYKFQDINEQFKFLIDMLRSIK